MKHHFFLGLLCVIAGIVITAAAAGDLLLRVLVGFAGLRLINYGLRLSEKATDQRDITQQ